MSATMRDHHGQRERDADLDPEQRATGMPAVHAAAVSAEGPPRSSRPRGGRPSQRSAEGQCDDHDARRRSSCPLQNWSGKSWTRRSVRGSNC